MSEFNEEDARRFYRWLGHKEDEFTEIRAITWPPGSVAQHWITNEEEFIKTCKKWSGKRQVYAGVNPRKRKGGSAEDVARITIIPFDVDSSHPKNQPATEQELEQGKERMINLVSWMRIQGYVAPLVAMSGNGYHVLQRVNIEIENTLTDKLEAYFHEAPVLDGEERDSIFDPPRIIKVPGTLSIKGTPTKERPHRLSYIVTEGDPIADEALGAHIVELEPYSSTPEIYVPPTTKGKEKKRRTSGIRPCFKRFAEEGGKLSAKGKDDNNLRLALVSESHSKGYSRNEIIELFSKSEDWDKKLTTYNVDRQLGKIAVEGQMVWSCQAIHKHNGCLGETCKRYAKQFLQVPTGRKKIRRSTGAEEEDRKKESLDHLGAKYVFATPDDVEILYLYQDGKYVPAKTIIHAAVEAQHEDDSSGGLCAAVVGHFKRRSYVKRSEFNKFDNFMPVENGLLNLTTFELTPHTPDKIFTFKLETAYLPGKKCPKFMKYFNESLPNKEAQQVVQEFSGYTLLPAFPHHYFLFMIGGGRNGKGTLMRTLTGILGAENVSAVPLDQLDGKHRFVVATLFGKLMNVCSEPSTKKLHPQILKKVTGQDLVHGEIKNKQNPLNFIPFAKWFVLANELPPVNDTTLSFWDRLQLVEYTQSFTDEEGNKITDIEELWLNDPDERSGVLNWMIAGLKRLQEQGGITQTLTMKQKKLEYKKSSDPIGAFLSDETQCIYGPHFWLKLDEVYDAYKRYAEEQGIMIESENKLTARLKKLPNVVSRRRRLKKGENPTRIWIGIGLASPEIVEEWKFPGDEEETVPSVPPVPPLTTYPIHPLSSTIKLPQNTDIEIGGTVGTGGTFPINEEATPPESENGVSGSGQSSPEASEKGPEVFQDLLKDTLLVVESAGFSIGMLSFLKEMAGKGYHQEQVSEYLPSLKAQGFIDFDTDSIWCSKEEGGTS